MLDSIISVLRDAQHIVISTHARPDGDAIGSQLGLGLFLKELGKSVTLLNSDPAPHNMEWLSGSELIQIYDGSLAQLELLQAAEVIVVVDTNTEGRLGPVGKSIRNAPGKKVIIDHHTEPETWFDHSWIRETASSAAELVFEVIRGWDQKSLSPAAAMALYVGIMTDTGSFRFSNVSPALHRIIADLIEVDDLDVSYVYGQVYEKRSAESIRLLSSVLSTMNMWYDGRVGTMGISRRMMQDIGASTGEAEGFVNHLLTIETARVAIMFTETARGTKASFRSKEDFEVNRWAASFGGGGHRYAAGAFIKDNLENSIRKVMDVAPKFLPLSGSDDTAGHEGSDGNGELNDDDAAFLASLQQLKNKYRSL